MKCPQIDLKSPESDKHNSNVSPTISFHVYQHIECCTVFYRTPFNENKQFQLCGSYIDAIFTTQMYTRKELVRMESSIVDFHWDLYIPAIQKLALNLPHIHIIGTHHCGNTRWEELKCHSAFQNVLCCCDYSERVLSRFAHQIQSE